MIPSSGCPPWLPDHPRTLPRTGTPTPPRGARPGRADWQEKWGFLLIVEDVHALQPIVAEPPIEDERARRRSFPQRSRANSRFPAWRNRSGPTRSAAHLAHSELLMTSTLAQSQP